MVTVDLKGAYLTVSIHEEDRDFMVKVDLKDAYMYFTVPIHEEDRDFLKFTYKNTTYRFNCLPFGLAWHVHLGSL